MAIELVKIISIGRPVVTNLFGLAKSRLERQYTGYAFFKSLNLASTSDSFDNIYVRTIYNLINIDKRHREIMRIFELEDVRKAFKTELYEKNNLSFALEVDHNVHTNQSLRALKLINIDIDTEVEAFRAEFWKQMNLSRTPDQLDTNHTLAQIEQQVAGIQNSIGSRRAELNQQIRNIEVFLQEFKVLTCEKLCRKLLEGIYDSNLAERDRTELEAKAYHLLSLCRIGATEKGSSMDANIEAYLRAPSNNIYKSRAATSYHIIGDKANALRLANEVLVEETLNERAWFVKLSIDTNAKLADVPPLVIKAEPFKLRYVTHLFVAGKIEEAFDFMKDELEEKSLPENITSDNIDYWGFVEDTAYFAGIKNQPNDIHIRKGDYSSNELITYANKIGQQLYEKIQLTEIFQSPTRAFKYQAFVYLYTEYLLHGKADQVLLMMKYWESTLFKWDSDESIVINVLISLSQCKLYKEVLRVSDKCKRSSGVINVLRFWALVESNRIDEALLEAIDFIRKTPVINVRTANAIFMLLDKLSRVGIDTAKIYDAEIKEKNHESELIRTTVYSYIHRYNKDRQNQIIEKLDFFKEYFAACDESFRVTFIMILSAIEKHDIVLSLIDEHLNWRSEGILIMIYTESAIANKKDSDRILSVLKERRSIMPEERLLSKELGIYSRARNYVECLDICRLGMSRYPENANFKFNQIVTLYKTNDPQLEIELTDALLGFSFSWIQKFSIARICLIKNKTLLGLELFYREAKKEERNPIIRQHFLSLTTILKGREEIKWPEKVEVDTVAEISNNDKIELLEITDESIANNWIVKTILEKKPGESVTLKTPLGGKSITLKVVRVFDKYSGLTAQIFKEVQESNLTGMSVEAFDLESDDVEKFKANLMELFGERGDHEKIRRDSAFQKFYKREISFTDLVASVTGDQPLDIYNYLTSLNGNGFPIIPLINFRGFVINEQSDLVVDLTSIPILKIVSEKHPSVFKKKFLISQFTIEYLHHELENAIQFREEQANVAITSSYVNVRLTPPGYRQARIDYFKSVIEWCDQYCEPKIAKLKMDLIIEHPEFVKEEHLYENYLIDTSCLSFGRVLISDDHIHVTKFGGNYPAVSLEFYLYTMYPDIYKQDLLPILIEHHYLGIRLYKENVLAELRRPLFGGKNTFHYCLENLKFAQHGDEQVLFDCIDVIRDIYLTDNFLAVRKQIAQNIFVAALSGYPGSSELPATLRNVISDRFRLLQPQLFSVMDDLATSLQILSEAKKNNRQI